MARLMQYVSRDPVELNITPIGFRCGTHASSRFVTTMAKLSELSHRLDGDEAPGTSKWILANTTGFRFDVQKPHIRAYFLRAVGVTDEQIEAARKALVAELECNGHDRG
jgi:hypothetical protein